MEALWGSVILKNKNIQISKDYGEIFEVFEDMITWCPLYPYLK